MANQIPPRRGLKPPPYASEPIGGGSISRTWQLGFAPPDSIDGYDEDERLRLRLFVNLLVLLGTIATVFGLVHYVFGQGPGIAVAHLLAAVSAPLVLLQLRIGVSKSLCVGQFMIVVAACVSVSAWFTSGIMSPIMAWLSIVPMFGVALDSRRMAVWGALLVTLSMVAIATLSILGIVQPLTVPTPLREIITASGLLALSGSLIAVALMSESTRLGIMSDLAHTNDELMEEVGNHTRTRERLQRTHRQLVDSARLAGAAEIATGVLHNLGNALNTVNVSASLLDARAASLRLDRVERLAEVIEDERAIRYIHSVFTDLSRERDAMRAELEAMQRSVRHATQTVAAQQRHAGRLGVIEAIEVQELLDDALLLTTHRHDAVTDVRICCHSVPRLLLDRHRLVEIVTNLVANAHDALRGCDGPGRIEVHGALTDDTVLELSVRDDGPGIAEDDLDRVFAMGFTTKHDGHGFGLHASAVAAAEMGGSLTVHSDGPGTGATFTLRLPVEIAPRTLLASR